MFASFLFPFSWCWEKHNGACTKTFGFCCAGCLPPKLKPRENLFVHTFRSNCPIAYEFCIEHGNHTVKTIGWLINKLTANAISWGLGLRWVSNLNPLLHHSTPVAYIWIHIYQSRGFHGYQITSILPLWHSITQYKPVTAIQENWVYAAEYTCASLRIPWIPNYINTTN